MLTKHYLSFLVKLFGGIIDLQCCNDCHMPSDFSSKFSITYDNISPQVADKRRQGFGQWVNSYPSSMTIHVHLFIRSHPIRYYSDIKHLMALKYHIQCSLGTCRPDMFTHVYQLIYRVDPSPYTTQSYAHHTRVYPPYACMPMPMLLSPFMLRHPAISPLGSMPNTFPGFPHHSHLLHLQSPHIPTFVSSFILVACLVWEGTLTCNHLFYCNFVFSYFKDKNNGGQWGDGLVTTITTTTSSILDRLWDTLTFISCFTTIHMISTVTYDLEICNAKLVYITCYIYLLYISYFTNKCKIGSLDIIEHQQLH